MPGTPEGARRAWESKKRLYGDDYGRKTASHAGKSSRGGFASEKVGKDGLTGRERAKISGAKGGHNTPTNFKNDPERAKRLSQEYRDKQKGVTNDSTEVPT